MVQRLVHVTGVVHGQVLLHEQRLEQMLFHGQALFMDRRVHGQRVVHGTTLLMDRRCS